MPSWYAGFACGGTVIQRELDDVARLHATRDPMGVTVKESWGIPWPGNAPDRKPSEFCGSLPAVDAIIRAW